MGLSVGGQSGSQNGYSSGNQNTTSTGQSSGTSNATTTGQQTGTTSGTQTGTQTGMQTGQTGVNTTGIYDNAGAAAAGALGGNGYTAGQQSALANMQGVVQNQPMGFALAGLNNQLNGMVGAPTPTVTGQGVDAQQASSFMDPYRNSYASDVLNPSLNAFDQGTAIQANTNRARRDAGSAFGDRAAVADSIFNTQQDAARGALAGQITGQGYNTALGAGQSDASNYLAASQANAANKLAAQTATGNFAMQGRGMDLSNLAQQANNYGNINTMGVNNAQSLYNMGSGGQSNLLALMNSQVPAFGTNSSGTSMGTSTGATSGTSNLNSSGSSSGSTTGNTSGNVSTLFSGLTGGGSSSKGGGIG